MTIDEKIHACWLGKSIGGTLGGPHEGKAGPLNLDFYDPVPESALPNDDLDLQVVWLHHLLATGATNVTPDTLAEAWQRHVKFPFDEYGICLRNISYGLRGADLGTFDNWFAECMGAAIRSEIWACLAPGEPERAAGFAWCDAVCDHAGDGVWAEVFLAALESAAFVEHDRERLLNGALAFLPEGSRVRIAIEDTRQWWRESGDWRAVRERIMAAHGSINFTDVAANLAFTVLGWLAGGNNFGNSICIATNCGQDTDCTAATLGSLLGILDPGSIPKRWMEPIGEEVVISEPIVGIKKPANLSEMTERVLMLRHQLAADQPRVGVVKPRAPAESGPIRIVAEIADWDGKPNASPPEPGRWRQREFPGHWIARPPGLLRFQVQLDAARVIRIMAWSPCGAAVWLDGARLDDLQIGCNAGDVSAPSFHRGGTGHFSAPVATAGQHALIVACPDASELVVGVADASDRLWLPRALAADRR